MNINKELLDQIAEETINDYFENIESIVDKMVNKIIETYKIEDNEDINYLRNKITRGILKFDTV